MPSSAQLVGGAIEIRGARQNNLKGINLDLELNKFHVITGPSGSGKSSLAFDTIYAEGQRRYVETFSPYARQFLDRMDKPVVDEIRGIRISRSVRLLLHSEYRFLPELNPRNFFLSSINKASCEYG